MNNIRYDEEAQWIDQLKPAFGEDKFFFEEELDNMESVAENGGGSSGQLFQ